VRVRWLLRGVVLGMQRWGFCYLLLRQRICFLFVFKCMIPSMGDLSIIQNLSSSALASSVFAYLLAIA
jgi:hypothetical protein